MNDQQTPQMKDSDAPGDQDRAVQDAPAHAEGLAEEAAEESQADEADGGYGH